MLQSIHRNQNDPILDFTYGQLEQLKSYPNLFSGLTAEQTWGTAAAYPATEDGGLQHLAMTQMLAPNYFQEMGVRALLGRVLDEDDAKAFANVPAVLSYQFWQSCYGGRKDILGRVVRIKNYPFTIVGVLPRDFHSIDIERAPDVRLPISAAPFLQGGPIEDPRGAYREGFQILVRLRPGVNPAQIELAAGPRVRRFLCNEFRLVNASLAKPYTPAEVQITLDWFNEGRLALAPIGPRALAHAPTVLPRAAAAHGGRDRSPDQRVRERDWSIVGARRGAKEGHGLTLVYRFQPLAAFTAPHDRKLVRCHSGGHLRVRARFHSRALAAVHTPARSQP